MGEVRIYGARPLLWMALLVALCICGMFLGWWYWFGPGAPKASIRVTTDPPDSRCYLDGVEIITSPNEFKGVARGMHKLKITKLGYETLETQLQVQGTEHQELSFTLKPLKASLHVDTEPPGAMLYLDGQLLANTPLDWTTIEAGSHKLSIVLNGYEEYESTVYFARGEEKRLHIVLIKELEGLEVISNPPDADVYVDSKPVGRTPLAIQIPPGEHDILVAKDATYEDYATKISLSKGQSKKLTVTLNPKRPRLIIETEPREAQVFLNDRYLANTPLQTELASGRYRIRVSKKGWRSAVEEFVVSAGETKRLDIRLKPLPSPGTVEKEPATGMEFVWVPEGCFTMGSPGSELKRDQDEGPTQEVCLNGFWMGRFEVTQGQWQKIMGSNPSSFKNGPNFPVENVSWKDAKAFVERFSSLKKEYVVGLPTEAEWEYACRAGTTTAYGFGQSITSAQANIRKSGSSGFDGATVAVGSFQPNQFGIYDMHGNVWEWCEDWYDPEFYKTLKPKTMNPVAVQDKSSNKVLRGGSWLSDSQQARCANRHRAALDEKTDQIGFRVVMRER
ncbi:MAG: PEGA domain-containing protein [Dissulfuribacterales bacterium]